MVGARPTGALFSIRQLGRAVLRQCGEGPCATPYSVASPNSLSRSARAFVERETAYVTPAQHGAGPASPPTTAETNVPRRQGRLSRFWEGQTASMGDSGLNAPTSTLCRVGTCDVPGCQDPAKMREKCNWHYLVSWVDQGRPGVSGSQATPASWELEPRVPRRH